MLRNEKHLRQQKKRVAREEWFARLNYFRAWLFMRVKFQRPRLLSASHQSSTASAGISCSFQELLRLRNDIHALLLSPPRSAPQDNASQFISAFRGRGLEYDTARHYQAGDEVRHIDWRVTARTLKTHVKVYHEERERPVCFLVDHSESMHFATRNEYKSVRASKTAALLAWLALSQNEKVGGIVFDEMTQRVLKPTPGDNGVLPFLKSLQIEPPDYGLKRDKKNSELGSPAPIENTEQSLLLTQLQRFNHLAPRGSLCFVLSDFRALGAGKSSAEHKAFEKVLYDLSQRCDLTLFCVYDSFEAQALPEGQFRLSDGYSLLDVNNSTFKYRRQHSEVFKQRLRKLDTLSKKAGFNTHVIATDAPLMDVLNCSISAVPGQSNFKDLLGG